MTVSMTRCCMKGRPTLQAIYSPKQRLPTTFSDSETSISPMFDASRSWLASQITRAEALAQALPFEHEGNEATGSPAPRQPSAYSQENTEGSRKRRKFNNCAEMDHILVSRSPTPEIKTEEYTSSQPYASPHLEGSMISDIKPNLPQPKKRRPNQRTNIRAKMLWTDEETADLIKGVNMFGYGKWKKVLNHPDLKFLAERTSVDLKDRYRTCLNNGWATNVTKKTPPPRKRRRKSDASTEFFPPYGSNTPPRPDSHYNTTELENDRENRSTTPCSRPPSPRVQFPARTRSTNKSKFTAKVPRRKRKQKQPWTRKEDGFLWAGYKKHGFKWRAIANDDSLGLTHRRCTAIRDRFRLMLPSLYMDNFDVEKGVIDSGKRKIHWSLRKLVGRDLDGPDSVLLALSEEGPGEEEGEATFTDQEDERGDIDDLDDEDEDDQEDFETNGFGNANGLVGDYQALPRFESVDYSIDSLTFDFPASEPLVQRFDDEDFDLGYDEEADEDYFDDGMVENDDFLDFSLPPELRKNPPDFLELWNDNDEDERDEESEEGSEEENEQVETNCYDDYLEIENGPGNDVPESEHGDERVSKNGREVPTTAAPLLWEEMATQTIFDLDVDD